MKLEDPAPFFEFPLSLFPAGFGVELPGGLGCEVDAGLGCEVDAGFGCEVGAGFGALAFPIELLVGVGDFLESLPISLLIEPLVLTFPTLTFTGCFLD